MHPTSLLAAYACLSSASAALIQGDCVAKDSGLKWLSTKLSASAIISCEGSSWQQYNVGRYWGKQFAKNASVVVFPTTTQDVSYTIKASQKTSLGDDLAFVSGAHGMTGAATATGFIVDLMFLNQSSVVHNYTVDSKTFTAISYQGGATWQQVSDVTAGTGWTAVSARISSVGVGGFSTGGGIGYLAGPYGFAIDRLRALEVVLPSGKIVLATQNNAHKDLFWALQGGGGQFGIVTTFYQEAAVEPTLARFRVASINGNSSAKATKQVVDFFQTNSDPFALIYYALGFFPDVLLESNPAADEFGVRQVIACVYFPNPTASNGSQKSFDDTYDALFKDLIIDWNVTYSVPYSLLTEQLDGFFPYGYRRGFYGPQIGNVTADYLNSVSTEFKSHVAAVLDAGDFPSSALWALQYMAPGLNGHLPAKATDTAWPHNVVGHQTLFSPAWSLPADDARVLADNDVFNKLTWQHQASTGVIIPDYPNYISPNVSGSRVWGDNVERLIRIKEKYDPDCRIHNGRVFASAGCIAAGWANVYA